jgi:rhodanese-related sulfurtransferase
MITTISTQELQSAILSARPLVLFEALGMPYFRKGHLPGAQQLDHERAAEQLAVLRIAHEQPIVVYCASATCANSRIAAEALQRAGYENVRVYEDGKQGWQEAGLALSRD